MTYLSFKNKWLAKRVDYDKVFGYQCVDLIKQYLDDCFGIKAGAWGDAIDYWNNTNPILLKKFNKIKTTRVMKGDIVIIKPTLFNRYGHIGIADKNYVGMVVTYLLLEQNGSGSGTGLGKDAIRVSVRNRRRIVGVLRAK